MLGPEREHGPRKESKIWDSITYSNNKKPYDKNFNLLKTQFSLAEMGFISVSHTSVETTCDIPKKVVASCETEVWICER